MDAVEENRRRINQMKSAPNFIYADEIEGNSWCVLKDGLKAYKMPYAVNFSDGCVSDDGTTWSFVSAEYMELLRHVFHINYGNDIKIPEYFYTSELGVTVEETAKLLMEKMKKDH